MAVPKVRRFVEMPYELYRRLEAAARALGLPVNTVMVQAVEQWLASHERLARGEAQDGGSQKA